MSIPEKYLNRKNSDLVRKDVLIAIVKSMNISPTAVTEGPAPRPIRFLKKLGSAFKKKIAALFVKRKKTRNPDRLLALIMTADYHQAFSRPSDPQGEKK